MDLGVPMKVELQSDSFYGGLFDRSIGSRTSNTRYIWVQERVRDGDLTVKRVLAAKNCADVGTKPVSASVLQHCKFAGLVFC